MDDGVTIMRAICLALALALTGCTGVVVQDIPTSAGRRGGDWLYYSIPGHMALIVLGNPTDEPRDAFDRRIAALMTQGLVGPRVVFEPWNAVASREVPRVAVLFANATTPFGISPCGLTESGLPTPSRNPLIMYVAMCVGPDALWETRGKVEVAGSDAAGALRELVNSVLLEFTRQRKTGGPDHGPAGP